MNVSRKKRTSDIPLAWRKMLADIPNGGSVKVAELGGDILRDGTPLSYDSSDHLYHVIKTAKVYENAASNAVNYKVAKGSHLKVGDTIYNGETGYAITAIDKSNANYDKITVGTTLGAATAGAILVVGSNTAVGLVLGHHEVIQGTNLEVGIGVIGTVAGSMVWLTSTHKSSLKGIVVL